MNFATLPPETNSGRMYSGPGARSMVEAAAMWDGLAARLRDAAAECMAVRPIAPAAADHVAWLKATSAQAQQAAARARAAASAYDAAFAATVPPPAIEANRARLRSLAGANCLGQDGPAIADTEADYERMWARDAEAMHAYARAAAGATALTRFGSPPGADGPARPASRGWALACAPDVISAGNRVMSAIPEALQALSASPLRSLDASLSAARAALSRLSSLSAPADVAIGRLNSLNKAAALDRAAALRALIPGRGAPATRGFGRGRSIGALSVPAAWATAAAGSGVCEPTRLVRGTAPREA
ncbi:PPE family protein [Mycobacterium sp. 663a-19]|uniref:PPE family protein n=1 Tax=Mycobacterium sp. 663a-19 TaxID=2986148 RepID=UPI002D1F47FB|nr:PPE family protein [Mycobacterium sp. 663a-19]MEB3983990.1 PPE family protein [Mycobacterium sp. 663a-19]